MSTQQNLSTMTETETETTDDEPTFEPADIRRRLPTTLTDEQERALIAAIRNPDAPVSEVAQATAVDPNRVRHALDSVACGVLGADSRSGEWLKARDGARDAETFAELTDRQAVVVDYLARNPSFAWQERAGRELLAAIQNADEGEAADAPEMHYTYPKTQAAKYESLIAERRAYLVEHEGLDLAADVPDVDDSALRPGEYDSTRELLDAAGYDLPAANLDSLTEQGEALDADERLDLAFRRASDLDDEDDPEGRTCEACGAALDDLLVCPECPAVEVYGGVPVENHLDETRETFTEAAVEKGVGYVGVVNAVEPYGVFVTIGGDRQDPEDVSGLMPERLVPDRVDLRDYSTGDPVRVVLNHTEDAEDEPGERLFFGWPAEGRVEGHVEQDTPESDASGVESDPAPEAAHATDGGPQAEQGGVSDDPREHTRVEDYDGDLTEYVAALERDTDHMGEVVAEQAERLDTLERENERLRERVDENAEALPSPEQIEELNEAAETVLGADARLDAMSKKVDALAERVEDAETAHVEQNEVLAGRLSTAEDELGDLREQFEGMDGESERGEGDLADALETLREYGFEGTFEI